MFDKEEQSTHTSTVGAEKILVVPMIDLGPISLVFKELIQINQKSNNPTDKWTEDIQFSMKEIFSYVEENLLIK